MTVRVACEAWSEWTGYPGIGRPARFDDAVTVKYLREVCDPCQGPDRALDPGFAFRYQVNGLFVSDFVVPEF